MRENGYIAGAKVAGGLAFVLVTVTGQGQIIVGTTDGVEHRFTYESPSQALVALDRWDGTGEPAGWHRHQPSNRRRPDGDPSTEHIAP